MESSSDLNKLLNINNVHSLGETHDLSHNFKQLAKFVEYS